MTVSRLTNGLSTNTPQQNLAQFGMPDPTKYHTYFNDFNEYNASDWTITTVEAGAGSASEALADGDGGFLLITNDAADNDSDFFNLVNEGFLFETTKRMFFKARFKVSDATQSDVVMGLQIRDTTPLAVSDGVYFQKDDGDANVDFHVMKNGTETATAALTTLADDTFITLGFEYNGKAGSDGRIGIFVDDVELSASVITNFPDDEEMTISFGIQNGVAVIKTMTIDYILVAKER